jgi:hypothetical protein
MNGRPRPWRAHLLSFSNPDQGDTEVPVSFTWARRFRAVCPRAFGTVAEGTSWRLKGWAFGSPHGLRVGRLTSRRSNSTVGQSRSD